MRCETARLILELDLARMGEADWRDLDAVEDHLSACKECQLWHHRRFIEENRLAKAMRDIPVPPPKHSMVKGRTSFFTWKSRQNSLICASLLLVLAALSLGIYLSTKPKVLDIESAAWLMREGFEPDFDGPTAEAKRIELERRFGLLGVNTRLPEGMAYDQLLFSGLVELQGKAVPKLVFASGSGEGLTQVLVFDSRQFDLSTLPETIPTGASTSTPSLIATDSAGRFVALVVEGFKRKPSSPQATW